LADSKLSLEQYLQITGQDVDQLVAGLREKATEQVRADLALRALADAEEIEVTDEDLADEIAAYADSLDQPVAAVARQFAEGGGLERLRSEIRNSKAVTWLVEHVEVVDEQGNPMDRALLLAQEGESEDPESSETAEFDSDRATVEDAAPSETEEEEV
jgi:trigger factor